MDYAWLDLPATDTVVLGRTVMVSLIVGVLASIALLLIAVAFHLACSPEEERQAATTVPAAAATTAGAAASHSCMAPACT